MWCGCYKYMLVESFRSFGWDTAEYGQQGLSKLQVFQTMMGIMLAGVLAELCIP